MAKLTLSQLESFLWGAADILRGKIVHGARNIYRDEQLNIIDAGEKVKKLIDEHITSTGVDPAIPPINLLDEKFNEHVNQQKSPQMQATEVKNAIRHHLNIKLDDDPAYYRKLSEKLDDIIQRHHEHWEELLRQLLLFREEELKEDRPTPQGVSDAERPFYNLCAEFMEKNNEDDPAIHQTSRLIANKLVEFLIKAHKIVDFFNKPDEIRRLKREIKNTFLEQTSITEDEFINTIIQDFMDLAKHRFGKS